MKLTWKNKKQGNINKKRPLSSTNLPFQQQQEEEDENNDNFNHSNISSSDDQDSAAKLADSFRDQGNKLAEVLTLLSVCLSLTYP